MKAIKDFMREKFGSEEQVFHFYNLGQEEAALEGFLAFLEYEKKNSRLHPVAESYINALIRQIASELPINSKNETVKKP